MKFIRLIEKKIVRCIYFWITLKGSLKNADQTCSQGDYKTTKTTTKN